MTEMSRDVSQCAALMLCYINDYVMIMASYTPLSTYIIVKNNIYHKSIIKQKRV